MRNYFMAYHNIITIEMKRRVNVMHLNHPETLPPTPVCGQIVFREPVLGASEVGAAACSDLSSRARAEREHFSSKADVLEPIFHFRFWISKTIHLYLINKHECVADALSELFFCGDHSPKKTHGLSSD